MALIALAPAAVAGQRNRQPTVLRIEVRDATGAAVDRATVTVGSETSSRMTAVTNDSGAAVFQIVRNDRVGVSMRKIGFVPVDSSVVAMGDTVLRIATSRVAAGLDTVRVTADLSRRQRAYHIGASEISNSSRVLIDAFDIVAKLRPDIAWGRGFCRGAANIWVNGRWIPPELVSTNDIARARATSGNAAGRVSRTVLYVLSEIKPEHIEEMTYHDCLDQSVPGTHGQAALFVTLKPGIHFDPGRGSYTSK